MLRYCLDGLENVVFTDIPRGYIVLVTGPPGSFKTGITFNIMANYLKNTGEFGVYMTLEESTESHLRNMESLGIEVPDNLLITDYSDIRKRFESSEEHPDFLEMVDGVIKYFKEKEGERFSIFALDSLGALYSLISTQNLRARMFHFFKKLRDYNLYSFVVMETPKYSNIAEGEGGEYFLTDGIIELGMIERERDVRLYLQVPKLRAAYHSRKKFYIDVGEKGLSVLSPVYD
ncbi:MAG: signal transduction protein [Thermoplasmata archaeon]|nr:signal transduction protein [Thermoplasmata archaeon]HDD59917.1 signal transduction protein [Euryarchaeota archaeon]RLF56156.1 MAG: signal transduction protein [Thermoplasmata archaeon]RLF70958.1 MAG: signal transduction protein [Thermoplasmata archaeon]RLF72143.1 MAG: signal transduction protein [Thermoplasmata archaeon]